MAGRAIALVRSIRRLPLLSTRVSLSLIEDLYNRTKPCILISNHNITDGLSPEEQKCLSERGAELRLAKEMGEVLITEIEEQAGPLAITRLLAQGIYDKTVRLLRHLYQMDE